MKKVLFITYYWPPSGKASSHWPLNIIKHIPEFGIVPSVLTVEKDKFTQEDKSLMEGIDPAMTVIRSLSFEPFSLYKKFTGKKPDEQLIASETISKENKNLSHLISIWIRMNLFVPDARVGWYFDAVSQGKKFLEENLIDAIVTVGPPHSTHLIGLRLAKRIKKPHIPVFIDPWVDIIYYKNFKRSAATLAADNFMEKLVLKNSYAAVFVTDSMKEDYLNKYSFLRDKSHVLYWGYNEHDFKKVTTSEIKRENVILHAGNIFDYQNPPLLWSRVKKEIEMGRLDKLKFIGTVSPGIKKAVSAAGLDPHTEYTGFLPYTEVIKNMLSAKCLLVCATEKRHLPGKLFEYLRTGNPILAFGDDNQDVKRILEETKSGMMFSYNQDPALFFERRNLFKPKIDEALKYDRKNIAKSLSYIINAIP